MARKNERRTKYARKIGYEKREREGDEQEIRRESERFQRALQVVTVNARVAKRDTSQRPSNPESYADYIIPGPDFRRRRITGRASTFNRSFDRRAVVATQFANLVSCLRTDDRYLFFPSHELVSARDQLNRTKYKNKMQEICARNNRCNLIY